MYRYQNDNRALNTVDSVIAIFIPNNNGGEAKNLNMMFIYFIQETFLGSQTLFCKDNI